MRSINSVGIIGYGNFGKFLHHLLRRFSLTLEVRAYDPINPGACGCAYAPLERIATCDVVVLAVPFDAFEVALTDLLQCPGDAIIVDVSTIKNHPVQLLRAHAQHRSYFAVHPMFGPESYTLRRGDVSNFRVVICDRCRISDDEMLQVQCVLERLGFDIVRMAPQMHDRHLAETLFLTHYIGQIVKRGAFDRTDIDTVSFTNLMNAVEGVSKDTKLFRDVFAFLPDECKAVIRRYEEASRQVHELLQECESV